MNMVFIYIFIFCSNAFAEFKLPDLQTSQQKEIFKQQLLKEGPWLAEYHGEADKIATTTSDLIPVLQNNTTWQKLALKRPSERVQFFINEIAPEPSITLTLNPEIKETWIEESRLYAKIHGEKLLSIVATEGEWLANHDVKAIITGLINSLPAEKRGEFHKLPSVKTQIEKLNASEELTDSSLQVNFRAQVFGISQENVTKRFLIEFANDSLARKEKFATLLRSAWVQTYGDSQPDPFFAEAQLKKEFFLKIASAAHVSEKKLVPFLHKYSDDFFDDNSYTEEMTTTNKVVGRIEVTEASPSLALTRGHLMGDCSMGAYGFACSPNEYAYLVRHNDTPIAFVVATAVVTPEGKKLLYIHDFGGQGVTASIATLVSHSFYQLLPQLGFDLLAISGKNGNYGAWSTVSDTYASQDHASLVYEDADFREHIKSITEYSHNYDQPEQNRTAPLFRPNSDIIKDLQVRFQKISQDQAMDNHIKDASASDLFLSSLKNYYANPSGHTTNEILAFYELLNNSLHNTLEKHYELLAEAFARHGIQLSGHFIQENSYLFWAGHLNAMDSTTTSNEKLLNQTARYMVQSLRYLPNPDIAIHYLQENLSFFKNNKHFQNYLNSFTGRGANELIQIVRLMSLGIEVDKVKNNPEIRERLIQLAPANLRHHFTHTVDCEQQLISPYSRI